MARFNGKFIRSLFETGNPRNVNNLWTGIGLSGKGKAIAFTGISAYAVGTGISQKNQYHRDTALVYNLDPNIYALPQTTADGVMYPAAYQRRGESSGQRVESFDPVVASGDLVFALHNLRHGG
jgi:hypothetical protein